MGQLERARVQPVCRRDAPPMISVTVYSTGPSCQRCRLTCLKLADAGIPFSVVYVTSGAASQLLVYLTTELRYSEAPVVVVDDEPEHHWAGFRPDLIERLAAGIAVGA